MIELEVKTWNVQVTHNNYTHSVMIDQMAKTGRIRFNDEAGGSLVLRVWRSPADTAAVLRKLADEIQTLPEDSTPSGTA